MKRQDIKFDIIRTPMTPPPELVSKSEECNVKQRNVEVLYPPKSKNFAMQTNNSIESSDSESIRVGTDLIYALPPDTELT